MSFLQFLQCFILAVACIWFSNVCWNHLSLTHCWQRKWHCSCWRNKITVHSGEDLGLLQHPRWSAVNHYLKALHLGSGGSPRSTSGTGAYRFDTRQQAWNDMAKKKKIKLEIWFSIYALYFQFKNNVL